MKVSGRIKEIKIDLETRNPLVTLEINEYQEFFGYADELSSAECIDIELKKHFKKRSLSANAYAWVMLDKLAHKLMMPKEEIYKNIVKNIGGNTTYGTFRTKDCDAVFRGWKKNGIGWLGEVIENHGEFSDVVLYHGSSSFDSQQMSRLIELIIQECREQEIPTETLEQAAYWEGLLKSKE